MKKYSRAAVMLLMMLLTTTTAWAASGNWSNYKASSFSSASGTTINITSEAELALFAYNVTVLGEDYSGYTITLTKDLNMSAHYWDTPIGLYDETHDNTFMGTFDGGNHTISGIYNSNSTSNYQGLFGFVGRSFSYDDPNVPSQSATVRNLTLASSTISGKENVGGIAAYLWNGTISNCHVLPSVTIQANSSNSKYYGGIVGQITPGQISQSNSNYNSATVENCTCGATVTNGSYSGCSDYGGIVGSYNRNTSKLKDCFYYGTNISASSNKGAIIGSCTTTSGISNCYYYYPSSINGIGSGGSVGSFKQVYKLTLGTSDLTISSSPSYTFNGTNYYATGAVTTSSNTQYITALTATSGSINNVTYSNDKRTAYFGFGSDATVTATFATGGLCGTNAWWDLSDDGTELTISGSGAMYDYGYNSGTIWTTKAPWGTNITSVTVGDGITSIGNYAFCGCQNVASVTIGSSVASIGIGAINHCDQMTTITLPASVNTIGYAAFENCQALTTIYINNNGAISLTGTNDNHFNAPNLQYIAFSSPAGALANTQATGNWARYKDKVRAFLGSQFFTATNEGGTPAYQIATGQDLRNLATAVNYDQQYCNGLTFRQTADIDLGSTNFTTISQFWGTYDGGNYTISNLKISNSNSKVGLFAELSDTGRVKNVRLINPEVETSCNYTTNVGSLIGFFSGRVENCYAVSPTLSSPNYSWPRLGALVGHSYNGTISNCYYIKGTGNATKGIGFNEHGTGDVLPVHKLTLGEGIASISPDATNMANGFVYNNETYYREGLTLTLTDNLGTTTSEGYAKHYYANGNDLGDNINTYTVNSTDGDATLTAAIRSDGQQHEVTYVDAQGESHTTNAIPLDGYEPTTHFIAIDYVSLNQGCYYVGTDITYTNTIRFQGDVTIILGNGKTMTSCGIDDGDDVTIFGQSLDTSTAGTLICQDNSTGIFNVDSYTQNSGNVSISCSGNYGPSGINASRVTLNGGKLSINVNGGNPKAIEAASDITINGGQLDATSGGTNTIRGLYARNGNITLGWTNATDYIHASSYDGTVNIASGQAFVTNDATPAVISGTITDMSLINGKTLTPTLVGSGTSDDPYLISNVGDWDLFCDLIEGGETFIGKYVKLDASIGTEQEPVTRMAGSIAHSFCGNFNGGGNTLTFNCTASANYVAPFAYVKGGSTANAATTITNLNVVTTISAADYRHVAGLIALQEGHVNVTDCNTTVTINSTGGDNNPTDLYPAGLVSQASSSDDGTLNISGCTASGEIATNGKYAGGMVSIVQGKASITNSLSSVTINSSTAGDGTHGGFVAVTNSGSTTTITGCLFNGSLLGENTNKCGGFIGWRNAGANIYNSIFDPAQVTVSKDGSATFARNKVDTYNCFYTYPLFNSDYNPSYAPYDPQESEHPDKYNNGKQARSITAGENVTVTLKGTVTEYNQGGTATEYSVSGITSYGKGILYNNVYYAGNGDNVSLTLSNTAGEAPEGYQQSYVANAGTLSGNATNGYTLTMPDENVTITSEWVDFVITLTSDLTEWEGGITYNVLSDVTITERINVTGDVTLHLGEGATLYATKGITVVGGDGEGHKVEGKPNGNVNSLTIEGTGTLNADMSQGGTVAKADQPNAAAIGGAEFDRDYDYRSWCGNITINGGTVYARSDQSSGIGCSAVYHNVENSGGNITINGGNVTAISKANYSAGIGGSFNSDFGTITINGGTVVAEAYGDPAGAAIGGGGMHFGNQGGNGTVNITGGKITAKVGFNGIGAGGNYDSVRPLDVNLDWTNADDYIDVKSISALTLTFTKPFVAEGEDYTELAAAGFADKKMVPADHTVTFDAGESSSTYNPLGVLDGRAISAPANDPVPTDATLAFKGWMNGSTPYDFTAAVTSDLTLTAAFGEDFTVSGLKHLYNYNNGSPIDLGYSVVNAATQAVLTNTTDYVVTISTANDNDSKLNSGIPNLEMVTEKGFYTLTVTGLGSFAGIEKTYEFAVDDAVTLGDYDFVNLGEDIYGISTAGLLEDLAAYTNGGGDTENKTFKLLCDIALDSSQDNNHSPIGNFNGTFDGQGYTISGISINTDNGNKLGLFGEIGSSATITRVKVSDAIIVGYDEIGGIVGSNNYGTIIDCVADASVKMLASNDNADKIGAIAGCNYGLVKGCLSAALFEHNGHGNIKAGGIVGINHGTIKDCIYTGSYVKSNYIKFGYFVGEEWNGATISNCYFTGTDSSIQGIHTNYDDDTFYIYGYSGYAFTINADEYVTSLTFSGTPTEYDTSGITTYDDSPGMLFGNQHYATWDEEPRLLLTAENTGHIFTGYKKIWFNGPDDLTVDDSGICTVSMPQGNVTIATQWIAYYLVGTMTDPAWTPNTNYSLSVNPATDGEYMIQNVPLNNGTNLKVVSSTNDVNFLWYPSGTNNNYVTSGDLALYDIYFRPDGQGGDGWHYGFFYVQRKTLGDVNGNGGIDIGDAVCIVNYLVGKTNNTFIPENADLNGNGGIDIGDAVMIVNILVGKSFNANAAAPVLLPVDEPEAAPAIMTDGRNPE